MYDIMDLRSKLTVYRILLCFVMFYLIIVLRRLSVE